MIVLLQFASTLALGLLAGALCFEGLVMVPYWRSLSARAFSELHAGFAPRLYRFFAPLTVGAVTLSVASGIAVVVAGSGFPAHGFTLISAALGASLLAFYALYFHASNERLPSLAIKGDEIRLRRELTRWHKIHIVRCVVCLAGFTSSLVAALQL
jgi:hypothetical protein